MQRKRIELGLMQEELADRLGMSRYTIMRMENGKELSTNLTVEIIKRLGLVSEDDYISFLCNDFGAFIKEKRLSLGMTQKELAITLNVSRKTVRFWEKEYSYPLYANYICLVKILNKYL